MPAAGLQQWIIPAVCTCWKHYLQLVDQLQLMINISAWIRHVLHGACMVQVYNHGSCHTHAATTMLCIWHWFSEFCCWNKQQSGSWASGAFTDTPTALHSVVTTCLQAVLVRWTAADQQSFTLNSTIKGGLLSVLFAAPVEQSHESRDSERHNRSCTGLGNDHRGPWACASVQRRLVHQCRGDLCRPLACVGGMSTVPYLLGLVWSSAYMAAVSSRVATHVVWAQHRTLAWVTSLRLQQQQGSCCQTSAAGAVEGSESMIPLAITCHSAAALPCANQSHWLQSAPAGLSAPVLCATPVARLLLAYCWVHTRHVVWGDKQVTVHGSRDVAAAAAEPKHM